MLGSKVNRKQILIIDPGHQTIRILWMWVQTCIMKNKSCTEHALWNKGAQFIIRGFYGSNVEWPVWVTTSS